MDMDAVKFFLEQFDKLRDEIKGEIKALRHDLDKKLGSHDEEIDAINKRLTAVEQVAWRVTAICGACAFFGQIAVTLAIEYFKK